MSELDLDAIEARAEAATPGPWHASKGGGSMGRDYPGNITSDETGQIIFTQTGNSANTRFIAGARTDVPALIARVREIEGLAQTWMQAVENCEHEDDGFDCYECAGRSWDGHVLLHVIRNGRAQP
ncbi:hypothetical protein HOV03_gp87 [Gordonia phage Asapag]|uniref:Uncharacterized protein n=1 Tax=Gordonia phage Asapag TaxID=2507862 RepID=A0A410TDX3_9CAUD|nr:hypothetical protein HOV03_gp87 [Gordonia phage Asapag]QAU07226.1 hypothetical protein SEA_ASAPAG_87 [Gordonia phage Asapag]